MLHGPARAWSIVLMSLLCGVLSAILLHRPPPSVPKPPPRSERPLSSEERRSMYRMWPMFQGWPLPQLPPDTPAPEGGTPQPPPEPSR